MTCEWAEGYLSAYLDDALDPQLRKDVGAHIESCARCQALAEEYRRNDQLVATLAPLTPPDELHQRIFESPAFAALSRELEREADDAPPGRRPSRRVPLYLRAVVPAAALLTISLGAALLFRQGLLPFGAPTASQKQTDTIGGPSSFNLPLSAGPRLVYLNGGALWSIAEYAPSSASGAPGRPEQLTAAGVRVAAFSVSPLTASDGGARIAYVDARTGALHVVHSDGQADILIGAVTPTQSPSAAFWTSPAGRAALAGLAWSPDSSRLAYVTATADGGAQLRVYTFDGSSVGALAATTHGAPITQLTWSGDGHALAFTTTNPSGASTVMVWRGSGQPLTTLAANPSDAQAHVAQVAWSGKALTWATAQGGAINGVYRWTSGSANASRLTASGASYSLAAFTAAHGGVWLLADGSALSEARLASGAVTQVGTLDGPASRIIWSPTGALAAIQMGSDLTFWNDNAGGVSSVRISGAPEQAPLIWSPDGAAIAMAQGQQVNVYRSSDGAPTQVAQLSGDASPIALAWSADKRNIAIAESQGMLLVASNGQSQTLLTSRLADGGVVAWSIAR